MADDSETPEVAETPAEEEENAEAPAEGEEEAEIPDMTTNDYIDSEITLMLDRRVKAGEFSAMNAFYFATLSKLVYRSNPIARGFMMGDDIQEGLGFTDFHWFEPPQEETAKDMFDTLHDTEAFVAADDTTLVVVFRGTKEGSDWATNLKFGVSDPPEEWGLEGENLFVHQGFQEGLDTVWIREGMRDVIRELYHEKERKLYFCGHSLGGALATIAAAHMMFVDDMKIEAIYTMGSPRVFSKPLAEIWNEHINDGIAMKDKYFRCRNNNDIVCTLPLGNYEAVGTEVNLNRFGTIAERSAFDRLAGRCSAYLRGEFLEDINDHATSEYVRLFLEIATDTRQVFLEHAQHMYGATHNMLDPEGKAPKPDEEGEGEEEEA